MSSQRIDIEEERVHDCAEWVVEALSVIEDVKDCVKFISISNVLCPSDSFVYLNLTILEGEDMCIRLCEQGFQVTGKVHDSTNDPLPQIYETIYSLLDTVSPKYREAFSDSLIRKLLVLQNSRRGSSCS